jgi:SAM-dependent methyltransferase
MNEPAETNARRLSAEAGFHDQRIQNILAGPQANERKAQGKYYWAGERYEAALWRLVERLAPGSTVLELGCFTGARTVQIGRLARAIVGIDISPEAVTLTSRRLAEAQVRHGRAMVANAECLPFGNGEFDLVFGSAIIHHVDVAKCASELYRVLRPGGIAVFREPLGHNPLINLYRGLTPAARTVDEHPLLRGDLATLRAFFSMEESRFFGLTSLLATPFRRVPGGRLVRGALEGLDACLLGIPALRHYAWQVNLVMRKSRL